MTSHAVIVSCEFGLRCVVSVTDCTKRIHDGARLRVDGDAGTVLEVSQPRHPGGDGTGLPPNRRQGTTVSSTR